VAAWYASQGLPNIYVLQGGMLAWQVAGLLEALEVSRPEEGE
jgi:rhodanese-related sulfurtransferase